MTTTEQILAKAEALKGQFAALGGHVVNADVLQPAETLLDLYGEDIRARAYVTNDPLHGEMMLRPDFTVPVVQMHMETYAEPARYTYSGAVFRKQEHDASRANEYVQVGYEVFDGQNPAGADAEVFAAISKAVDDLPLRAATGDIGLLTAAISGLRTSDARKAALLRHLWRPQRFKSLLDRFCGKTPVPTARTNLLADSEPFRSVGPDIGLRSRKEVSDRIEALRQDAALAPISADERELLDAILKLRETLPNVLSALRDIAVDMPSITDAVETLARRADALTALGLNIDALPFEGSYGRTNMEYYDGFVFGFYSTVRADLPPLATGGRYDALTAQLGAGRAVPAVGAVIRRDLLIAVEEGL